MASEDTLNLDYIKELLASSDEIPEEKFDPEDLNPEDLDLTGDAEAVIPEEEYRDPLIRKFAQVPQGQRHLPEKAPESIEEEPEEKQGNILQLYGSLGKMAIVIVGIVLTALLLTGMMQIFDNGTTVSASAASGVTIMDKFDMFMTNQVSSALDGVLSIEKVYWLSDADLVAPEPNPTGFGTAESAAELGWLLEEAKDLIGGQEMFFSTDTPELKADKVYYYYDPTVLAISWKNMIKGVCYTFTEVKIAHPSQFRRFMADGVYGSNKRYVTTDMSKSVNAVLGTSGDFYQYRDYGLVVNNGEVLRAELETTDTCFIDTNGDLQFAYRGQFASEEDAQRFVDENNIRFSLAFGPVLIDNGQICVPPTYKFGEINGTYTRVALCQKDELHYMIIIGGGGHGAGTRHTMKEFAEQVALTGCKKAYALDGGQTTVVAMNGELISHPDFGYQRQISDIIYFATALPNGE